MDSSIRNRAILIAIVLVACVIGIVGLPRNIQQLKQNLANRIHLGLDLKGGAHLVLQVHVDDAVKVTTDEALGRLEDDMKTKNIPYASAEKQDLTHIIIKGVPTAEYAALSSLVSDQFSDWDLEPVAGDATAHVMALKVTSANNIRNQALMQSMRTIRNRVDQYGVVDPEIAEYGQGDYELVVELPGVSDTAQVRQLIKSQAMLELKIVKDGPYPSRDAALAAHGGILPPNTKVLPSQAASAANGGTAASQEWYVVDRIDAITGRDLSGAEPSNDENGQPDVNFTLTSDGAARFASVTSQNIGKQLAIVLDSKVVSAPVIHSRISDQGQITGSFTAAQARDLALVLRTGALPASITTLAEQIVGPTLGADSIRHGIVAAVVGFIAIIAFMLIYYRGAGINADVALLLNLLILMAAFAYLGAVLTLPGIAGVILTVGMGVDSNVLIFERIREELRLGKAVGAAVAGGFEHAFKTIIDTHVTTVASAAILFTFGTGPIKGFATTLTIGLVANLFTSVFVSRVIFDWALSRREKGEALSI